MKHRLVVIGVAAVVLAGGAGYLAGRGHPDATPVQDADAAHDRAQAGATQTRQPATGRATETTSIDPGAALPAPGTPLVQMHDELVRRAAAGEARAACRLASEHERCEMERVHLRTLVAQQAHHENRAWHNGATPPEDVQLHIAQMRDQQLRQIENRQASVDQCDAAPPLSPDGRARYWRQAALAGHLPSMRHYASGNSFRWHDLMDALPALQTYRREAEGIARRAAMQGDAASAYALAMAYADSDGGHWRPFLAQATTPDLTQALMWFSVLARHPDITRLPDGHPTALTIARQLATLQAAATPAETAQAARLSEAVALPHAPSGLLDLRLDGGFNDVAPEACTETQFATS